MNKTKILTLAAVISLLLMPWLAFSASATTVPTFTLNYSSNQLTYDIPQGTTFNGSVSTTGMVRVWVSAPNGEQIVNLGIVDKAASFSFVAGQNGTYLFNFENDLANSVDVTFSYIADPQLPQSNYPSPISLTNLIIIVVMAVLGSLLLILVLRRKSKKEAAEAALIEAEENSNQSAPANACFFSKKL